MPSDLDGLTPEERAEYFRSRIPQKDPKPDQAPAPVPPFVSDVPDDLVPDAGYERSEEDRQLDGFLEQVDVVGAYRTFIGKMEPQVNGKTEGIMISCPMPGHADTNPSAWLNVEKGTWFCGGCQVGGDSYDLAAIGLNFDVQNYKTNGTFPQLRRGMADRLGFTVIKSITGEDVYIAPEPEVQTPDPPATPAVTVVDEAPDDNVFDLSDFQEARSTHDDLLSSEDLRIDWERILPNDTFLRRYLEACTIDDLPHEYHFFNGLQLLGFAAGRNNYLRDFRPVLAKLYVCLYGRTGVGKSRSADPMMEILRETMPFSVTDAYTAPSGVMITPTPGSAEALLDMFRYELLDPSTNQVVDYAPVTAMVKIEELSSFIARASRVGSSMKELIMEMFDMGPNGEISLRTRSSGTSKARGSFLQMHSTTQPKAISSFLRRTDTETGFLNRWILAAGLARRAPISYGGVLIDVNAAKDSMNDLLLWTATDHTFLLQGDAYDAWDGFFHANLAAHKSGLEDVDSMVSRVDLTLKKLILLLTVDRKLDQPTGEVVEAAVSLYNYFVLTYSAFSSDISFNDVTACQNRIINVIENYEKKYGRPPTSNQIRQQIGKKFDLELIIRALKNLVTLDIVTETSSKHTAAGRPTKRYSIAGS